MSLPAYRLILTRTLRPILASITAKTNTITRVKEQTATLTFNEIETIRHRTIPSRARSEKRRWRRCTNKEKNTATNTGKNNIVTLASEREKIL